MQTKKDFDAAAARLFGDIPPKTDGAVPVPYRADQYQERFGIDVHQYTGFYAEVGHADAATGPVTPATERIKIHPILTIRQSNRGNFYVRSLSFAGGLFNQDKTKAWIKTEEYDKLLGDDYFDKVEQKVADLVEEANSVEGAEDKPPVQVIDLASLSQQERTIFDKIRSGTDFGDLTSSERDIIAAAMTARQE